MSTRKNRLFFFVNPATLTPTVLLCFIGDFLVSRSPTCKCIVCQSVILHFCYAHITPFGLPCNLALWQAVEAMGQFSGRLPLRGEFKKWKFCQKFFSDFLNYGNGLLLAIEPRESCSSSFWATFSATSMARFNCRERVGELGSELYSGDIRHRSGNWWRKVTWLHV